MAELDAPAAPPLNTMAMELRVGRKYRLGKKIGSGSFGGACAFRAPFPFSLSTHRHRRAGEVAPRAGLGRPRPRVSSLAGP